ncbi:hypothetical protein P775_28195 [Puniceibacterium antarcticum]|uniref:DUF1499 domain-containing protein n=1 Tax=Puniceibacterium antarcticum TaxID=1206336 RepID=A0A2G8QU14_9RHOB|nr:DUF1499 domain-containing protein [Puniceibacterium antarcticum]PIL12388.1 hypothetical protein P775_28195 [Puniceibacterium antarcticum]
MIFWSIVLIVVGGIAWIRLAPSNPEVWNVDPMVTADQDLAGGVRRRLDGGREAFEALDRIILATPRTELLAGSAADSRITYITRSKWMAFPDYTTVELDGDHVELYARLRFGQSDMGVNKARVEGWLAQLKAQQGS